MHSPVMVAEHRGTLPWMGIDGGEVSTAQTDEIDAPLPTLSRSNEPEFLPASEELPDQEGDGFAEMEPVDQPFISTASTTLLQDDDASGVNTIDLDDSLEATPAHTDDPREMRSRHLDDPIDEVEAAPPLDQSVRDEDSVNGPEMTDEQEDGQ